MAVLKTSQGNERATSARPEPILAVQDLVVAYGAGAPSLNGVSLGFGAGEAVALLGANGAGKTTTIRALTGLLGMHGGSVVSGSVTLDSEEIVGVAPHKLVRRGLTQVPEGRMVFAELTVRQNLVMGSTGRRDADAVADDITWILDIFPALHRRQDGQAGYLSGGEQQMLAIGRGLMSRPRVLVIDELSLGLAPLVTRSIFEQLASVRREFGTAMLFVEQNANVALEFCDYAHILEGGRMVLEGEADELRGHRAVADLYLGSAEGPTQDSETAPSSSDEGSRWLS